MKKKLSENEFIEEFLSSHKALKFDIMYDVLYNHIDNKKNWHFHNHRDEVFYYNDYPLSYVITAVKEFINRNCEKNHPLLNVPDNENAIKLFLKLNFRR